MTAVYFTLFLRCVLLTEGLSICRVQHEWWQVRTLHKFPNVSFLITLNYLYYRVLSLYCTPLACRFIFSAVRLASQICNDLGL